MAKECTTLTLADLADTSGWQEPAEAHTVYGLELNERGYYARTPVATEKYVDDRVEGAKTMKGGIDLAGNPLTGLGPPVGASDAVPKEYVDGHAWDVRIELREGFFNSEPKRLMAKNGTPYPGSLTVFTNMGTMLVSYHTEPAFEPESAADPEIVVAGDSVYALQARLTRDNQRFAIQSSCRCAEDEVKLQQPPMGSVIFLEVSIAAGGPLAVEVVPGSILLWGAQVARRRLGIVFTHRVEGWVTRASEPDLRVSLLPEGPRVTDLPIRPRVGLVRLLYSTKPVADAIIARLISQLKG